MKTLMIVRIKGRVSPPAALIGLPIIDRLTKKADSKPFMAVRAIICGPYAVMNIVPRGGPTLRAATVAGAETGDLHCSKSKPPAQPMVSTIFD